MKKQEPKPIGYHKIHSFPKIFPVGSDFIPDLFKGKVEVTEKIDGSQFDFGLTREGELVLRSKGKQMFLDNYEKMFEIAVDWVAKNEELIRGLGPDIYFYGEYLGTADHNILKYARVPKNNIIIFGVMLGEGFVKEHSEIVKWAEKLDLETVPLLYSGEVETFEELQKFLDIDSILGTEKVEGLVVKNYLAPCIIGNLIMPSMGKYVREDFKERHATEWGAKFSGKDKMEALVEGFRTEARWHKAIQHLKEKGELVNDPKDIGILLKELERDMFEEEEENIKTELFKLFKDKFARRAKAGFPEFYKKLLAEKAFVKEVKKMKVEIKSTKDYSLFKKVWHNRKLNNGHLKNLTASVARKNLLAYTPIIVNERMEVIDGQHRLEVAKRSKLDIYYIVAPDVATGDILLLNANEKPWGIPDFVESWIKQGKKDFATLKKFTETYDLPITMSAMMLCGERNHKGEVVKDLREGTFLITQEESATDVATKLAVLKPHCQINVWRNRDFVKAFWEVLPKMNWERLLDRLEKIKVTTPQPLTRQVGERNYVLMFEDIYNYNIKSVSARARLY